MLFSCAISTLTNKRVSNDISFSTKNVLSFKIRYFNEGENKSLLLVACVLLYLFMDGIYLQCQGSHDSRLYVWDVELDSVQYFNFATGCDEADDSGRPIPTAGGDADATIAER